MMLAVLFWVAGFDVLYAIQDTNFDREHGLNSIPSRFGVSKARLLAFIFHCIAITLFNIQGVYTDLGWIYFFGLALFSIVLLSQHWIIQMRGLAEINHLFFSRNGAAAVIYFVAVLLDVTLRSV